MSCQNCFNGCAGIVSDQCIKYTGDRIEFLDISNGDSLAVVEQKFVEYLETVLDGTGIIPDIIWTSVCDYFKTFLPSGDTFTLTQVLTSIINIVCSLNDRVTTLETAVTTLNASYTIPSCLTVSGSAGTHAVLQAVITKLCTMALEIIALKVKFGDYVKSDELDGLIQDYLDSIAVSDKMYTKMVPYVAVEYYGPLANYPTIADGFTADGTGYGAWVYVRLCNGNGGYTPDKRGFSPVGAIYPGGNKPLDAKVSSLTYAAGSVYGDAEIILTANQVAAHTHLATPSITPNPHAHTFDLKGGGSNEDSTYAAVTDDIAGPFYGNATTSSQTLDIQVGIAPNAGGDPHDNIPPVLACNYIMYVPPA